MVESKYWSRLNMEKLLINIYSSIKCTQGDHFFPVLHFSFSISIHSHMNDQRQHIPIVTLMPQK